MTSGTAYGFFNSYESKDTVEKELNTIHHDSRLHIPSLLELKLFLTDQFQGSTLLMEQVIKAQHERLKYILEANYSPSTNEATAKELSVILNQSFQLDWFDKHTYPIIIYQENGKYLFKD